MYRQQQQQQQQLDGDGDGVLDREEWQKWWVQRWQASAALGGLTGVEKDSGMSTGEDDESNNEASGGGGSGNAEKVSRLSERARQAHRRAGTDIHTAAWRGDLALVKVCRRRASHMTTYIRVKGCRMKQFCTMPTLLHHACSSAPCLQEQGDPSSLFLSAYRPQHVQRNSHTVRPNAEDPPLPPLIKP